MAMTRVPVRTKLNLNRVSIKIKAKARIRVRPGLRTTARAGPQSCTTLAPNPDPNYLWVRSRHASRACAAGYEWDYR